MSINIEGKIVVITGASSGLGEATTRLLSQEGATVMLPIHSGGQSAFAMSQPKDVDVNEILFRTTRQEL